MFFGEPFSFFARELLVYKVQRLMTGALVHQLGAILFLGLMFTVAGAFLLSFVVPKDQDRYNVLVKDAHILMNRVPPYVWGDIGALPKEKFMRNVLFLSNVVTMSIITGIVAATMKTAVDNIIEGNHQIVERGHVVVLADKWDEQIVSVVRALDSVSAEGDSPLPRSKQPIVLLTPMAKKQALSVISESFSGTGRTPNVMVRSGDPMSIKDLQKVCISDAKHVLYLSSERNLPPAQQSSHPQLVSKIKTQAALLRHLRAHQMSQWEGTPAAVLALPRGGPGEEGWKSLQSDFAVCVEQEFVGRLLGLCVHPSDKGLAEVYNVMLRRGNTDFHTSKPLHDSYPWLVGLPFSDLQKHFARSVVCGLVRKNEALLAPPSDMVTNARDRLIFAANNDLQLQPIRGSEPLGTLGATPISPYTQIPPATTFSASILPSGTPPSSSGSPAPWWEIFGAQSRKVVVLNWNERGAKTVAELKMAFPEESTTVTLLTSSQEVHALAGDAEKRHTEALSKKGGRAPEGKFVVRYGQPLDERDLVSAGVLDAGCVVVLSDAAAASRTSDSTDAHLLAVVEAIGRLPWPEGRQRPSIVGLVCSKTAHSEILVACQRAGLTPELIMAEYLEAGALVQVLLNPQLVNVYQTLLSKGGSELHLAPATALLPCTNPNYKSSTSDASAPAPAHTDHPSNDAEMWSGIDGVFWTKAGTQRAQKEDYFRGTFGQVQEEAAAKGQVAVGVLRGTGPDSVLLNPPALWTLRLTDEDRVILIGRVHKLA